MHYIIPSTLPYYVRSGYINMYDSTLRIAGISGYGWSQVGYSDVRGTYYLSFNSSGVNPLGTNDRYVAFYDRTMKHQ